MIQRDTEERLAPKGTLPKSALAAFMFAMLLSGCSPSTKTSDDVSLALSVSQAKSPRSRTETRESSVLPHRATIRLTTFPKFADVAKQCGIEFTYDTGTTGKVLMVESSGGGAGWLDFDGDDLLDICFCQGGDPLGTTLDSQPLDQLYRQVEPGRFEIVTHQAKLFDPEYGQGVAIADFDDDGFDDLYITNYGPNTFWRNQGDGTFLEISKRAGVDDRLWSTSAAWGDLDGDGDLDLYVCNYVEYDVYHPTLCLHTDQTPATCNPVNMTAVPDECYFNQGDGTFKAEAQSRGLYGPLNKGLGVVIADFNNDGLPDVFVANDTSANFLFLNQGQGQFIESAQLMGCAVSHDGTTQANMGIAVSDYDRNGWLDLYVTHFTRESNTLYKNLGSQGFQDVTGLVGLHTPTLKYLGFGTIMTDFNQDGHEDIFVTNGHIDNWTVNGDLFRMPPQMFSYEGPKFIECSAEAGEFFKEEVIGRGVAQGDFDNDGDWDLAVVHQGSPAAVLRNDSNRGHWLKMRFMAASNRRGVGTRVTLHQGSKKLVQELIGGGSYCAGHELCLIFGLGDDSSPCHLEIRWPDGSHERVESVSVDQKIVIRQISKTDRL